MFILITIFEYNNQGFYFYLKILIFYLHTNLLIRKILNYIFNTLKNKNKINKNVHFHKNSESNLRSKIKCSIK